MLFFAILYSKVFLKHNLEFTDVYLIFKCISSEMFAVS